MIHSSELMPGGSPYFPDSRSVERLYEDLEAVFSAAAGDFECLTLAEYADRFAGARLQSASQRQEECTERRPSGEAGR
jgi:hypothetical protein